MIYNILRKENIQQKKHTHTHTHIHSYTIKTLDTICLFWRIWEKIVKFSTRILLGLEWYMSMLRRKDFYSPAFLYLHVVGSTHLIKLGFECMNILILVNTFWMWHFVNSCMFVLIFQKYIFSDIFWDGYH